MAHGDLKVRAIWTEPRFGRSSFVGSESDSDQFRGLRFRRAQVRSKTSAALVPPKPKELERTRRTRFGLAS